MLTDDEVWTERGERGARKERRKRMGRHVIYRRASDPGTFLAAAKRRTGDDAIVDGVSRKGRKRTGQSRSQASW